PTPFFEDVVRYFNALPEEADLLYVSIGMRKEPTEVEPAGLVFRGFDYGHYESETNYFSSILNEILYGIYPELTSMIASLNPWLLLNTAHDVQRLESTREELMRHECDLESAEDEAFGPVSIYSAPPAREQYDERQGPARPLRR
ncbi:MAG: hypothetical protein ABI831_27425, partial [Betaproteobacteria bacterium]